MVSQMRGDMLTQLRFRLEMQRTHGAREQLQLLVDEDPGLAPGVRLHALLLHGEDLRLEAGTVQLQLGLRLLVKETRGGRDLGHGDTERKQQLQHTASITYYT